MRGPGSFRHEPLDSGAALRAARNDVLESGAYFTFPANFFIAALIDVAASS